MQTFTVDMDAIKEAYTRLSAFNKANGILHTSTDAKGRERTRSRFLGVAVDLELHRRKHGTFGETYADVTVPDDGGEDLVLNGWTIDLKVTRADLHPNSWVFSKFQHESRKSGDRGYVFLRACPVWNSQDSLPSQPFTVEVVGALTYEQLKDRASDLHQQRDEKNVTKRVTSRMLNPWKLPNL